MMKFLKSIFSQADEKSKIEDYLSNSLSLEDLERRQREIARGEAPWQLRSRLAVGHI